MRRQRPPLPAVIRNVLTKETTPMPDHCELVIGEGQDAIIVTTYSGEVEVRGMRPLAVLPHVANVVTIQHREEVRTFPTWEEANDWLEEEGDAV